MAPCVIYSMGSEGDFSFERAMLAGSECDVFTFDCSFDGKSIDPRHTYKKWCLGKRASAGFRSVADGPAKFSSRHSAGQLQYRAA